MTKAIELIEPTMMWKSAFLEVATEFVADGDSRYQAALTDFAGYLERVQNDDRVDHLPAGRVRQTTYWGVVDGVIVGCSRLRHDLTPALQQIGGHIGYDIRPRHRRQGYGARLLALTLGRAYAFKLQGVLITCDTDNVGSSRVIEKNGGRLLNQAMVTGYDKLIARYWIDLAPHQ